MQRLILRKQTSFWISGCVTFLVGGSGVEPSENRLSEPRLSYNEAIKLAKLEELYRRAYKILYDNRDFLLAVQKELLEHETLLNSDLAKIRESCT